MAGEELKSPGTNGLTTNNPLYGRGLPERRPSFVRKEVGVERSLVITILFLIVLYLVFGPIALLILLG